MERIELAKRKKRCYDFVVRLGELGEQETEQEHQLSKLKKQRIALHEELETERRAFVDEWTKAAAAAVASTASTGGQVDRSFNRAEHEWNEWVGYARDNPSAARADVEVLNSFVLACDATSTTLATTTSADTSATTDNNSLPVPQLQERIPSAEPPRLRSTRRSRRSFSLTNPSTPSTPVRKKLEWADESSGYSANGSCLSTQHDVMTGGSGGGGITPSPECSSTTTTPASSTSTSTATSPSPAAAAYTCTSTSNLAKVPTPVRAQAASSSSSSITSVPAKLEMPIDVPSSSSSTSTVPPSNNTSSARVLFEE